MNVILPLYNHHQLYLSLKDVINSFIDSPNGSIASYSFCLRARADNARLLQLILHHQDKAWQACQTNYQSPIPILSLMDVWLSV